MSDMQEEQKKYDNNELTFKDPRTGAIEKATVGQSFHGKIVKKFVQGLGAGYPIFEIHAEDGEILGFHGTPYVVGLSPKPALPIDELGTLIEGEGDEDEDDSDHDEDTDTLDPEKPIPQEQ